MRGFPACLSLVLIVACSGSGGDSSTTSARGTTEGATATPAAASPEATPSPPETAPPANAPSLPSSPPQPPSSTGFQNAGEFSLTLGRGSGRLGLETARLRTDGHVELHATRSVRKGDTTYMHWERAELQLSSERVAELRQLVSKHDLAGLQPRYRDPDIADGTQWVLLLQQGEFRHAVYCDNKFPPELEAFARALDQLLQRSGVADASWSRVPDKRAGSHDQDLWRAVE